MDMSTKGPSMDWSPDSNLPNRYKLWKQKCNLIFDTILCEKSEEYKCKMLLCYSGDRGLELFNSWTLTTAEQKKLLNYWQNFENYVKPQANQIMARYKLYCLKQNSQSVDIWLTSASELATESGYTVNIRDEMLRDHIVFATNSEMVRTKCLEVGDDLTLDQASKFAFTYEHTQRQLKEMGSTQPPHDVHSVKHVQRFPNKKRHGKPGKHHAGNPPHNNPSATTPSKSTNKCLNCGGKRHPLDHCPAKAATCFKCGRNGHYANLCLGGKKPSINTINETDDASTYLLSLDATCNSVTFPKPVVNASVQPLTAPHSTNIPFKVDTGADVSILSKPDYIHTFQDPELCDLQKSSIVLTAFGGSDIVSLGSTTAKVTVKGHTCNISFIVTETLAPNILADALSRISLRTSKTTTPYSNAISIDEILCSTIQMSTTGTQRIRDETAKDVTLQHLTRTIVDGWPEVYKDCPADLHPFWNFRDELSVENQLLFKGDRVVIPSTLQPEILKHLHTGHMGTEKMQLRARSSVFWPGLTNDVKNITKSCEPCQKHAPKQRQEEILVHEPTATKPWSKLACDIFDIKGQSYIVIADYYSRFPYVKQLSNITSKSIINVFKPLFADHGFCDILVTDNGPSYVSKEFTTFLEDCSIRHITSSPMYPQSNGFAESMVKVMKNLITKSVESNEDPNWALQAYRATPLSASLPSPAEMLHGRPLRTNIPSSRPSAQNDDTLESQHRRQQSYVKPPKPSLPPLQQGQDVNMYNHTTHTWQPATVSNVLPTPRSYQLSTDNGGKYRRNRRDIRDTSPNDPQCGTNRSIVHTDIADKIIPSAPRASNINGSPAKQPSTPNGSIDTGHYVTGSGRISKPPAKYE